MDRDELIKLSGGQLNSNNVAYIEALYEDYLNKQQYNKVAETAELAYKMLQELIGKLDKDKDRMVYLRLVALSSYWKLNRDLYISRSNLDGNQ